jgi:hypothetical protein
MNIVCDGPGPHVPADGILGTSSIAATGMRCSSPACKVIPDAASTNANTLRTKAVQALTVNAAYLAQPAIPASPTNAQLIAAVKILRDQLDTVTKENNALIRLSLNLLDDVSDT